MTLLRSEEIRRRKEEIELRLEEIRRCQEKPTAGADGRQPCLEKPAAGAAGRPVDGGSEPASLELRRLQRRLLDYVKAEQGRTNGASALAALYKEEPRWKDVVLRAGGLRGVCEEVRGLRLLGSSWLQAEEEGQTPEGRTGSPRRPGDGRAQPDDRQQTGPWAASTAHARDVELLDGCVEALLAASAPEADRSAVVEACVRDLEDIVSAQLPEISWQVEPFGSSANGFGTDGSDLDVVAFNREEPGCDLPAVPMLRRIQSALEGSRRFEVVARIFTARVPILKLRYRARGSASALDVDLSLRAPVALENTKLLAAYASLHPHIRKLGVLVKLWAKEHDVSGAADGNLSSYALTLMVIYYLQVAPAAPGLPSLQQVSTDARDAQLLFRNLSAGTLLCGFFCFYSSGFNWGEEVVSVRLGQRRVPEFEEFEAMQAKGRKGRIIHIEDPYELQRNLGVVLYSEVNYSRLRAKLDEAAAKALGGLRLQLLPGASTRALPAETALLDAGAAAVARLGVEAAGPGYKALAYGERVSVLYRGSDDNEEERGWLWVQSPEMTEAGWVPESAVIRIQNEEIRTPLLAEEEEEERPVALTNDFFMHRFKTLWCPVGVRHDWQTCEYAHNYQDARRHPGIGYGPRPCPYWKRKETALKYSQRCPDGVGCPFSHGAKEQFYHPTYFKTVPCQDWPNSNCPRGALCAFWHKRSQQRARPSDDEFNYKQAIPEKKLQEGLQPDFLSPPFKLLNSLQADPQALAALEGWADMGNRDYGPMDYGMMGDGTWWPPAICGPCGGGAGTPTTPTTAADDEAARSDSSSDKGYKYPKEDEQGQWAQWQHDAAMMGNYGSMDGGMNGGQLMWVQVPQQGMQQLPSPQDGEGGSQEGAAKANSKEGEAPCSEMMMQQQYMMGSQMQYGMNGSYDAMYNGEMGYPGYVPGYSGAVGYGGPGMGQHMIMDMNGGFKMYEMQTPMPGSEPTQDSKSADPQDMKSMPTYNVQNGFIHFKEPVGDLEGSASGSPRGGTRRRALSH